MKGELPHCRVDRDVRADSLSVEPQAKFSCMDENTSASVQSEKHTIFDSFYSLNVEVQRTARRDAADRRDDC